MIPAWRPARSLLVLRDEVNAQWPNRDKASDGMIGDPAHAATWSDHNPNSAGVVCAFDITHDPDNGPDIQVLFNLFRSSPHPDCKYLIANRRIASRQSSWEQRMYTGVDPHTSHLHVSVGVGPDGRSQPPYDDLTPSWLTGAPKPPPTPEPPQEATVAAPATIVDSLGRRWVFFRGKAGADGTTPLMYRVGSDPTQSLGGNVTSDISAIPGKDGIIDVYAYTPDGSVWARHDNGATWDPWYPL